MYVYYRMSVDEIFTPKRVEVANMLVTNVLALA